MFSDLFDRSTKCNTKINRELNWNSPNSRKDAQNRQKQPVVLEKLLKPGAGKAQRKEQGAKLTRGGRYKVKTPSKQSKHFSENQKPTDGDAVLEENHDREEGEQSKEVVMSPQVSYCDEGQ